MSLRRILCVDDDPTFGQIMQGLAKEHGVVLTYFTEIGALRFEQPWRFDIGLIDYHLGELTGLDVAKYLEKFLGDLPIVIVSQDEGFKAPMEGWPKSVVDVLSKRIGHLAILEKVLKHCEKYKGWKTTSLGSK